MSNTAEATPVASGQAASDGLGAGAACVGAVTVVTVGAAALALYGTWKAAVAFKDWLNTADDATRLADLRAEHARSAEARALTLKQTDQAPLARAAEVLGFRRIDVPNAAPSTLIFDNSDGELLQIAPNSAGQMVVLTTASQTSLSNFVQQSTYEAVMTQLERMRLAPQAVRKPSGELTVLAREDNAKPDGKALVEVVVKNDGQVQIDVDCIHGNRCDTIVNSIAEGAALTVGRKRYKPGYQSRTSRAKVKVGS